jgi:hypothetical protein
MRRNTFTGTFCGSGSRAILLLTLCVLLAICLVLFAVVGNGHQEGWYRGRPPSYWRQVCIAIQDGPLSDARPRGIIEDFSTLFCDSWYPRGTIVDLQAKRRLLLELLRDEDGRVKVQAACIAIGEPIDRRLIVQALIDCLRNGDARVVYVAAANLGRIGPDAKEAIPLLREIEPDDYLLLLRLDIPAIIKKIEGTSAEGQSTKLGSQPARLNVVPHAEPASPDPD